MLIDRLVNRHQHLLAVRLAEYMKIKVDRILVHWASEKVWSRAWPLSGVRGGAHPT